MYFKIAIDERSTDRIVRRFKADNVIEAGVKAFKRHAKDNKIEYKKIEINSYDNFIVVSSDKGTMNYKTYIFDLL